MSYTYICPSCLARQGAPVGGKLVSQEIGDNVSEVYRSNHLWLVGDGGCVSGYDEK